MIQLKLFDKITKGEKIGHKKFTHKMMKDKLIN